MVDIKSEGCNTASHLIPQYTLFLFFGSTYEGFFTEGDSACKLPKAHQQIRLLLPFFSPQKLVNIVRNKFPFNHAHSFRFALQADRKLFIFSPWMRLSLKLFNKTFLNRKRSCTDIEFFISALDFDDAHVT